MRNKLKLAKIYSEKAKKIANTISINEGNTHHAQILLRRARRIIIGAGQKDTAIVKKIKRNVCQAYTIIIKNSGL